MLECTDRKVDKLHMININGCERLTSIVTNLVNTVHLATTKRVELYCKQRPIHLAHVKLEVEPLAQSDDIVQLTKLKMRLRS